MMVRTTNNSMIVKPESFVPLDIAECFSSKFITGQEFSDSDTVSASPADCAG
jgi:hypothetical protein